MNYLPVKHGRGRPRHVVHIGRLFFPSDVDPSFGFLFSRFDEGLFPDSCFCYCAFSGASGCLRSLRLLIRTFSGTPLFSVTFKGVSRTIDGRLFFDVSKVVFVGVLP